MPALSPERFLKLDIPIKLVSTSDGNNTSENCDCTDSDFWVYSWPSGVDSQLSLVEDLLRRYKYRTVDVAASNTNDSPASDSKWDTIQEQYLGPTLEVLNRDLFDPILSLPPLRAYISDAEHGPMRIATITINNPDDDTRAWCGSKETFNAKIHKKCFGVAIFLQAGAIRPQDFPPPGPVKLKAPPIVHCAIKVFLSQSQQACCPYGMVTDGITSVVFNEIRRGTSEMLPEQLIAEAVPITKISIRLTLAMFAYHIARKSGLYGASATNIVLGALPPARSHEELASTLLTRRHFCDFDLFTMQRSSQEWWMFCEWKRISRLLAKSLRQGDILALERGGFSRRFLPWKSPYPSHHVPPETLRSVKQFFRPRIDSIDALMASPADLSFEISDVCRANSNTFSQVFLGHITGSSRTLCLKLFDERFFPTPNFRDVDFTTGDPACRLLDLNFAEDMMRCEQAAYDRLAAYLQGYIIPHCYGFYVFTLPDGWEVLGFLMEAIDAPSLSNVGIPSLPREAQASFLTRLRHAIRALKFAGIAQPDWHLDQVFCPRISDAPDEAPGVILIDFAFTTLHLGDVSGTPVTPDIGWLRCILVGDLVVSKQTLKTLLPFWVVVAVVY